MKKNLAVLSVILLVLFSSLDSVILGEDNCEIMDPAAYEIVYTVVITNNGPTTIHQIDLWIPLTQEHQPSQRVEYSNSDPNPLEVTEDESGNKIAHIRLKEKIGPGKSAMIRVRCKVQVYALSCKPVTSTFEEYDKNSELYKKYTAPGNRIESDNPQIREKAAEVAGEINDPYLAAKKIYEFVMSHMSYVRFAQCRGALYALQEKKGDCNEYSDLFIALCRARGIPARSVHGFTYGFPGDERHAWAEIYIPGAGWIPVDPTWGRHGKDYFGNITNTHVRVYTGRELSIGENKFTWYYFTYRFSGNKPNINYSITSEVKKTEIWYEDPKVRKEAESLYSEGENCIDNGDYDTALVKFQKAKELYSKLGDSSSINSCKIGISCAEIGKQAHSYFSEALSYFEKRMYSEAKSTFNKAKNLYTMVGNKQRTSECETYMSKCDTGIEADSLVEKGKAHYEEGALDEAKLSYETAQKKYEEIGDKEKVEQCQQMIQEIEKKNQEKKAEKEPDIKGSCLGTLFVALLVIGGSAGHLRSSSHHNQ